MPSISQQKIARLIFLFGFAVGCSPAQAETSLSPQPGRHSATQSFSTPPTQLPTRTPSPLPSTPTNTSLPTQTATSTPAFADDLYPPDIELPLAEIELLSPADGARIVSPITVRADLFPGPGGRIRIELLGEDGRSLARRVLVWSTDNVKQSTQTLLYFEINGVAEAGRLVISVDDAYGRLKALSSADVILLSDGFRNASFSTDMQERILVLYPPPNSVLSSGSIQISGLARPRSERALSVQIIARDGRVLAFGQATPSQPEGYDYSIFSIQLAVAVSVRQWVQIAIRETGSRVPGDVHFTSLEVVLAP